MLLDLSQSDWLWQNTPTYYDIELILPAKQALD
jgi:hypothetical protein